MEFVLCEPDNRRFPSAWVPQPTYTLRSGGGAVAGELACGSFKAGQLKKEGPVMCPLMSKSGQLGRQTCELGTMFTLVPPR